ncbi:unnamed protein product [Adineta ricciae]|uniref:Uncharacterized protein n=1 Tax=Adineta ricciae TaxID=249248 RepID=A0A814YPK8_ADIRI|nr:unnamed protein product [Adineta ricciae]CAF1574330.1 unnamed protein product [Adineta ricciae]
MHRTIEEDLQATKNSHENDNQQPFYLSQEKHQQIKAALYYETDHSLTSCRPSSPPAILRHDSDEQTKSIEHFSPVLTDTMPTATKIQSSASTHITSCPSRSSTIYIDEMHTAQQEVEKRELNTLNGRFGNYLDKIKHLVNVNANLRRQVDQAYRKYIGHTEEEREDAHSNRKYLHPCESQLLHLRKQINEEVRAQTLLQIRLQRADFDIEFYQHNIKVLTSHDQKQSEQVQYLRQQLNVNLQDLEHLKRQYERQEQDLNTYKSQYKEYTEKLMKFSNEYDTIAYERMENENILCTLREQYSFEKEFYHRRQEEFEYLEKFQYDFDKQFNKTELHQTVQQIRQDYQEFNRIRLSELEKIYESKLDVIRQEFVKRQEQKHSVTSNETHLTLESTKKEYQTLIEQNQSLQDKLEQLQHNMHDIIEQNKQRYELSDREYKQLQVDIPALDSIVVHLRENAVNLSAEINTYKYLLVNLFSTTKEKSSSPSHPRAPVLAPPISKPVPSEKQTTTSTTTEAIPTVKKITTTVATKARSTPRQYRDETTGFVVHIEDGIIWVRI